MKVKSAFFTKISKTLAKKLTFRFDTRYQTQIVMLPPIPTYTRTNAQASIRDKWRYCCDQWNALTEEEKQSYEEQAKPLQLTGFNLFMQECMLAPIGLQLQVTEDWEA